MALMMGGRFHRAGRVLRCHAWLFILLCAGAAATGASAAPAPEGPTQAPLVVATDDNYPPYIFRDASGTLMGYLVDVWALWERKTGVPVELLASDWALAQQHMQTHRTRVIDTIFQTPEREKTLDFTPAYAQIPVTIYTHARIGGITGPDNLQGFLVGVKAGDACIDALHKVGITTLQAYASYEALVQAAIAGQVRIFCLDEPPANYLLYKNHAEKDFNQAFRLDLGELHRAVHKGDADTLALVNRGFAAITAAEDQALRSKWMGNQLYSSPYVRYLAYALLAGALIGALLLLWSAALRRRVKQRTAELEAERMRLRVLLESIPDLVWMKDGAGIYRFCNPMFERFFGAKEADIVGKTDFDFVEAELAEFFRVQDRKAIEAGKPSINEEWVTFADDDRRVLLETTKTPLRNAQGELVGVLGIARDITEHKQVEASLRIAATAFESQQGMLITDANNIILRINQSFADMTGYSAQEVVGQTPHMFASGHHDASFYAAMWATINTTGRWQGEVWDRRKSGEIYPKWLTITTVKGHDGVVTNYVGTHTDITERKDAEAQIRSLAFYDPLTLLPNRRLLADRLQQALIVSPRNGREGALLFIDLDHFKTLNDTLGHDKGDLLLQEVARRVTDCIRACDTVARLGGDEFVVMLEDLSDNVTEAASQAEGVGEKVLAALSQPFDLAGHAYRSSSSIGITLFGAPHNSSDELMKRADLAMYQAKAAGRNTLRFFDPAMQAKVSARAGLEADLREGLKQAQFVLYYQPQLNACGHVTGAESLVRWQHPQRGLVPPGDFIPLAEETGLILPLGNWVLESACRQLAQWAPDPNRADLCVAVNVSAGQMHQPDFVEQVQAVLARTGANPKRLKLELTESLLLKDIEDTIAKMKRLKAQGIGFSLDDFGTGYSSLSYLKRLPLEQLKIDQSFVRDVLTDPNDAAIARTVVALAQSLGLSVIAEGVETQAQRAFLAQQGCSAYQGYLFSRPLPIAAFEAYLARDAAAGS